VEIIDSLLNLEPHYQWLIFAAVLAIGEIIVPGVLLIWISVAAAATGIVSLVFPIPAAIQLLLFAAISLLAVYAGRRWYLSRGPDSQDPMLNDRSARMVGQSVIVVDAVDAHKGRVRVGDSEWPARGPSLPVGATARIAAVTNGIVNIEPAD
jgi:inner membrane protein